MSDQSKLWIRPCSLREANRLVSEWHRHHKPDRGHKFSMLVVDEDGRTRGVAIAGRPKARALDSGHEDFVLEVSRVATDGCPNACSKLLGGMRRAGYALGFDHVITYTLESEPGVSLKAAGWECLGEAGGGSWSCKSRPRIDKAPTCTKKLWRAQGGAGRDRLTA